MSLASLLSGRPASMGALLHSQTGGGFADPNRDYGNTGPDTPSQQPPQRGFSGFLDRFMNPTNGLGQFGRALVMAGGTPLGNAYALMDQQKATAGNADLERRYKEAQLRKLGGPDIQHVGDQIGIVDPQTGAFTPTYSAPPKDDATIQQARRYGATEDQIKEYALGNLNKPIPVQGFDASGAPTITFVPRSQAMPGSLAPPAAPSAGLGMSEPDQAPDAAEYERFVSALKPELRDGAMAAYRNGGMGTIPSGSPLSPTNNPVRPIKRGSASSGTPSVGATVGGYRFLGGNPKDKSSWVKN